MSTTDSNSQASKGNSRVALIAVGVLALLGLAYAIARVDILRARVASLEVHRDQQDALNGVLQTHNNDLMTANLATQDQLKRLAGMETELGNLTASLGELRGRADQSQRNWSRIEALYLLRLADDQLQLMHDVPTALTALDAAQLRLSGSRDSSLEGVRLQLAADIKALRNVPQVDRNAIYAQLTVAEQQVGTLKIAGTVINAGNDDNTIKSTHAGIERAWLVIKRSLAQLFVVRKTGSDVAGLITADEQTLRRHHLQLLLISMRQAVQLHDGNDYRTAVRETQQWLSTAFDLKDKQVAMLNQQLLDLGKQDIAPALPDISGSRRLLERYAPAIADSP